MSDFCSHEWLEFFPKDLIFEGSHFVLILEREAAEETLPLRFPMESAPLMGTAHFESLWKAGLEATVDEMLPTWGVELSRCVLREHRKGHHRVDLYSLVGGDEQKVSKDLSLVLGLCLAGGIPFYATRDYYQEVRDSQRDNEIFLLNQRWTEGSQKYLM